jgi:hypothetical protein
MAILDPIPKPIEVAPTVDFDIRRFQEGDEEGIIQLLKLSFKEWAETENPINYWRWKYLGIPLGTKVILALANGSVIGIGHEMYMNIKIGANIYHSEYGEDWATHPDYRGRGIYKKILEQILDAQDRKVIFDYWLSTNPIIIKTSEKMGLSTSFKFPYTITHLFKVKNLQQHLKSKGLNDDILARGGLGVAKTLNKVKKIASKQPKISNAIIIKTPEKFGDYYNQFWSQISMQYNYILQRDANFLNWRYCDPEGGQHIIKEAWIGDEFCGFAVLRMRKIGQYNEGYIMDLLTLQENEEAANVLLSEACNFFDERGVNAVHLQAVKGNPLQSKAEQFGFVSSGALRSYIGCDMVKGHEEDRRTLEDSKPSQLYFNYGDYYY